MTPEEIKDHKNILKEQRIEKRKFLKSFRIKKEKKKLDMPVKPCGPFFLYMKTLDRGEANVYDFARGAAIKWKMLPEEDKQKFRDESAKEYINYQANLKEWEAKMLLQGKSSLARKSMVDKIQKEMKTLNPKVMKKKGRKTKKAAEKKFA